MTTKTRRLLAATLTSALIAAPALVCGSPAHASTATSASLLGGLFGSTSTTTSSVLPAPLGALVDTIVTVTSTTTGGLGGGTSTPDPIAIATDLASGLTGALTSGDPTQVLDGLTGQLADLGFDQSDIASSLGSLTPDELTTIASGLLDLLPLTDLFGGAIPDPIAALLPHTSTPNPTDTGELIDAMAEFYKNQNMTEEQIRNDAAAKALPKSALDALLLALSKKTTTPPPATGPSPACTKATKNVKKLQKQVTFAKRHHMRAKAKRLAKKLRRAKLAKIRAC